MRTLFGWLKKKKSGNALKPTTAQQVWTLNSFKFVEAHLTIHTDTRQLGKVVVPTLQAEVEEEERGDDDDAASLASNSACSSSQEPSGMQSSTSQAGPSHVCDRRPKITSSTSSCKRVDEAIFKQAEQLSLNTGVQNRLATHS